MSTEPRSAQVGLIGSGEAASRYAGRRLPDDPGDPLDVSPEGQWTSAAQAGGASDPADALRASRDVPEPDSLGG